ncbi:MAG: hypothetical protein D6675_03820 [Gemmatimonadetes bacterium]|nr:MAG: hypothetical protein D6675_03820 [Gemmatimonadota bacterium]
MKMTSRILFAVAVLMLIGAYFLPLWQIMLEAPQYPEGIGLIIWYNDIVGYKPNDLNNVNGLNHYIGMRPIEPENILELKIIPYIIGFMILFGLLGVILGRKKWLYAWVITLMILGIVGLADYYRWGYDYGHNLDPTAAIKVPGQSYQPPLIGSKKILNFTSYSYPATGGWMIAISFVIAVLAAIHTSKLCPLDRLRRRLHP